MFKFIMVALVLVLQLSSINIVNSSAEFGLCFDNGYRCTQGGYNGYDSWGFWKSGSDGVGGKHNCTSYAAFRASQNGSRWPGGNLGHAGQWATNARAFGFPVDKTPAVGAIAQWIYGEFGHVAYVESINGDGSLTISQDNYDVKGNKRGGWTEITRVTKSNGWPHNFIHFADVKTSAPRINEQLSKGKTKVSINDYNGDGISDILWRNKDGNTHAWIMNKNGGYDRSSVLAVIPENSGWSVALK
jgi:surface antigen